MRYLHVICAQILVLQTVKLVAVFHYACISGLRKQEAWLFALMEVHPLSLFVIALHEVLLPVVLILLYQPVVSLHSNDLRETLGSVKGSSHKMPLKR